nr:MAG TPA: tail assembly chaperone protein [Caudoviricetes sp.]
MKVQTQSTEKPKKYSIENIEDSKCTVLFFDNIKETQNEEKNIIYNYDMYDMNLTYREGLEEKIENNYEKWLEEAKKIAYNEAATQVRIKRDKLLADTDWTQMNDTALSEEKKEKYKKYRKDLRDVPQQKDFPYNVVFPSI